MYFLYKINVDTNFIESIDEQRGGDIFSIEDLVLAMKITDKRYFISPINQTWDEEQAAQEHENARSVRWKINQEGRRRERKSRRHLEKHPRIVANRIARERSARYQTNIYIYIYSIYPPFISPWTKRQLFESQEISSLVKTSLPDSVFVGGARPFLVIRFYGE